MNQWGDDCADTSDVKKLENERFSAPAKPSEVDESVLSYEATISQRRRGALLSSLGTFAFIVFTICCVSCIFSVGAALDKSGRSWGFSVAGYAVSVQIKVLKYVWDYLSLKLVDLELHQYASNFNSSRALKTFLFSAINAFSAFFYVGFAMQWTEGCPSDYPDGCWGYLCHEMVIIFATYGIFTLYDILVPYGMLRYRIHKENVERKKTEGPGAPTEFTMSFLEAQAKMDEYGGAEQIEDYCQIVMPLAFVLMFGITLPFCSVLSLLCFGLQLRADAFKLTRATKRPFPSRCTTEQRGGALGVWMVVLQMLTYMATVTNCALIVFNLEPFKDWDLTNQLVLFYTSVLVAVVLQIAIHNLIPEVSADVALARRRHERQRHVIATLAHKCKGQVGQIAGSGVADIREQLKTAMQPVELKGSHHIELYTVPKLEQTGKFSKYFILPE
mmetsp:Transcript_42955/g.96688  ORF Transcript_42955/g.96688 Transcript_42955/m.96688 type:complete len:444 (+) Transcript_42955:3-1334(+)